MRNLVQEFITMLALSILMVNIAMSGVGLTTPPKSFEDKTRPYETHEEMLLVRFTVYATAPPEIESVERLERGRVTQPISGDNHLRLVGRDGRVLYNLDFAAEFLLLGDPPMASQATRFSYVVPYTAEVRRVVISTPRGETEWVLD